MSSGRFKIADLLHYIIDTAHDPEIIAGFLNVIHPSHLSVMVTSKDKQGKLPWSKLYDKTDFSLQAKKQLKERLSPLPKEYLPFKSPINVRQILENFSFLKHTPAWANLILGCMAVDAARAQFIGATTHIEVNDKSQEERFTLGAKLIAGRADAIEKYTDLVKQMKHIVKIHRKHGVANCYELSFAVANEIFKNCPQKLVEIYHIVSSDHVFVIIEPNSYCAVICDPLTGSVFPAYIGLEYGLGTFMPLATRRSWINVFPLFDPDRDYIEKLFSIFPDVKPHPCIAKYMKPGDYYEESLTSKYIDKPYVNGDTLLATVSSMGSTVKVQKLLSCKADPNILGKDGHTPLMNAAKKGHVEVMRLLLDAKANPNLSDHNGVSPLRISVSKNQPAAVALLLEAKADPKQTQYNGETVVFCAMKNNLTHIMDLFFNHASKNSDRVVDPSKNRNHRSL